MTLPKASEASPPPISAPPCHNRPARGVGHFRFYLDQATGQTRQAFIRSPFVDRCATHDGVGIGSNNENYPTAHGWLPWCATCRWNPTP